MHASIWTSTRKYSYSWSARLDLGRRGVVVEDVRDQGVPPGVAHRVAHALHRLPPRREVHPHLERRSRTPRTRAPSGSGTVHATRSDAGCRVVATRSSAAVTRRRFARSPRSFTVRPSSVSTAVRSASAHSMTRGDHEPALRVDRVRVAQDAEQRVVLRLALLLQPRRTTAPTRAAPTAPRRRRPRSCRRRRARSTARRSPAATAPRSATSPAVSPSAFAASTAFCTRRSVRPARCVRAGVVHPRRRDRGLGQRVRAPAQLRRLTRGQAREREGHRHEVARGEGERGDAAQLAVGVGRGRRDGRRAVDVEGHRGARRRGDVEQEVGARRRVEQQLVRAVRAERRRGLEPGEVVEEARGRVAVGVQHVGVGRERVEHLDVGLRHGRERGAQGGAAQGRSQLRKDADDDRRGLRRRIGEREQRCRTGP